MVNNYINFNCLNLHITGVSLAKPSPACAPPIQLDLVSASLRVSYSVNTTDRSSIGDADPVKILKRLGILNCDLSNRIS